MNTNNGVYWCARDLDTSVTPAGNHHFILLICNSDTKLLLDSTINEENGAYFYTVSAGGANGLSGKITMHVNDTADVKSVREGIDPDEHTSWYKPDYDIESHKIEELSESDIPRIVKYLENYSANQKSGNVPDYHISGPNCATWVNTLFKVLGIPDQKREEYGEFSGLDWGEEDLFDTKYFTGLNVLAADQTLSAGQSIFSTNSQYYLIMQKDCNAVIYDVNNQPIWATGTFGKGDGGKLIMQTDGNLVLYDAGNTALWSSKTHPYYDSKYKDSANTPAKAVLEDTVALVLYNSSGNPVWSSK
jgi:hypothetical protein